MAQPVGGGATPTERPRGRRAVMGCGGAAPTAIEIRREDDGELCGFVEPDGARWRAVTVFGGVLGVHDRADDAERHVRDDGLGSLAERWTLVDGETGDEQIVCIQQASPTEVTLALDYYSLPGVPTATLTRDELTGGRWILRR